MSTLFAGLYLYEVVLLVLGVLLFIMLAIGFFYQLMNKRSLAALLPYFILPIAMIGYPSVKDIQYKDGLLTLDKATQQLENNPTDAKLRQTVQDQVANVADRPNASPQNAVLIAKAQYALGDEAAAKSNLQKVLQADPKTASAQELQKKITTVDTLKETAAQVEANPENAAAKAKLAGTLAETSQLKIANPNALIQVARAQAALGEHAKALENTQKVLSITPNSAPALQLQNNIKARMVATPASH